MMMMMEWRRRIMIVVIVFERKLNWTGFFSTFAPELKLLPRLKGIFVRFVFRNKIVRKIHKILLLAASLWSQRTQEMILQE